MPRTTVFPPGPRGLPFIGNVPQIQRHPLQFLPAIREKYGRLVGLSFAGRPVICGFAPEHVLYCLTEHQRDFVSIQSQERSNMRATLGEGLLTTEGELHRQQRKLVQPAFHRQRIDQYADVMVRYTQEMLEEWQTGQEIELASAMQRLTLRIIVNTLFSVEDFTRVNQLSLAFTSVIRNTPPRAGFFAPAFLRSSALPDEAEEGKQTLDAFVYELIRERRTRGGDRGDILDMLLTSEDEGEGMTDKQARDQIMTLVAAGHETAQNSLCWTFYLLSQNPQAQQKLLQELHTVLAQRTPTVADLPNLPYLEWVINESWRMLPPVWRIGRRALRDFELDGYHFSAGTIVLLSQWVLHKDAEIWGDPEVFQPERWDPTCDEKVPRGAYFPFGLGTRMCIGMPFAQMETRLLLATMLQRYLVQPVPGHPIDLLPRVTLRPRYGMRVLLNPATLPSTQALRE